MYLDWNTTSSTQFVHPTQYLEMEIPMTYTAGISDGILIPRPREKNLFGRIGIVKFANDVLDETEVVSSTLLTASYWPALIFQDVADYKAHLKELEKIISDRTAIGKADVNLKDYRKQLLQDGRHFRSNKPVAFLLGPNLPPRHAHQRLVFEDDSRVLEFIVGGSFPTADDPSALMLSDAFHVAANIFSYEGKDAGKTSTDLAIPSSIEQDEPELSVKSLCFYDIVMKLDMHQQHELVVPWPAIFIRNLTTFPETILKRRQNLLTKSIPTSVQQASASDIKPNDKDPSATRTTDLGLLWKDAVMVLSGDDSRTGIFLFGEPSVSSKVDSPRSILPYVKERVRPANAVSFTEVARYCNVVPGYQSASNEAMRFSIDASLQDPVCNEATGKIVAPQTTCARNGEKKAQKSVLKDRTNESTSTAMKPKFKKKRKMCNSKVEQKSMRLSSSQNVPLLERYRSRDVQEIPSFSEVSSTLQEAGHVFGEGTYQIPGGQTFHSIDDYRSHLCEEGVPLKGIRHRSAINQAHFQALMVWVCYHRVEKLVGSRDVSVITDRIDQRGLHEMLLELGLRYHANGKWEIPGNDHRYDQLELIELFAKTGINQSIVERSELSRNDYIRLELYLSCPFLRSNKPDPFFTAAE